MRFYIEDRNATADVPRCRTSQTSRMPITITGTTEDGAIKAFTGIVQSVEHDEKRPANRRWRVTLLDEAAN